MVWLKFDRYPTPSMPCVILLRYTIGVFPINDDTSAAMASLGDASGAATALTCMDARRWACTRRLGIRSGWLPLCAGGIVACSWLHTARQDRTICEVDPEIAQGIATCLPGAAKTADIVIDRDALLGWSGGQLLLHPMQCLVQQVQSTTTGGANYFVLLTTGTERIAPQCIKRGVMHLATLVTQSTLCCLVVATVHICNAPPCALSWRTSTWSAQGTQRPGDREPGPNTCANDGLNLLSTEKTIIPVDDAKCVVQVVMDEGARRDGCPRNQREKRRIDRARSCNSCETCETFERRLRTRCSATAPPSALTYPTQTTIDLCRSISTCPVRLNSWIWRLGVQTSNFVTPLLR